MGGKGYLGRGEWGWGDWETEGLWGRETWGLGEMGTERLRD